MAARLVTIMAPDDDPVRVRAMIEGHVVRQWSQPLGDGRENVVCVVERRKVEALLDVLESALGAQPGFSIIVSPIEAIEPPLGTTAGPPSLTGKTKPPSRIEAFFTRDRLSTEELYDDILDAIQLSPGFLVMVLTSALIAGLGMRNGQTAIVIGAMVIAPFLSPAIGLAMAATVGDGRLALRSAQALAVGALIVVALMMGVGAVLGVDPSVPELHSRTMVGPADVVLALASGAAGVLAFSRGASASLVGVMIAVALVPPLSAAGMFLGVGRPDLAIAALSLFATNLICINIAGIVTFLAQGLPPKNWRITSGLLGTWCLLLLLLGSTIFVQVRIL